MPLPCNCLPDAKRAPAQGALGPRDLGGPPGRCEGVYLLFEGRGFRLVAEPFLPDQGARSSHI